MPAIAVVMPAYNRADSIGRAIDSVLAQDFADFELVIVDDGSVDGTADVINAVPDPRVRCLRQLRNLGGNAARNRGIRECESPLVCFLDSDDQFLPHKLGFVVDYFARHSEIDVLIDSFRLAYPPEKGKSESRRTNPELHSSAEIECAIFTRRLFKSTPAISARREALFKVGLFDETLTRRQDMDLILRLVREARCASTGEILWVKQWSANSISAKQETFIAAAIEICERHPEYMAQPEYRVGLARDTARHFVRLLSRGKLAATGADLRRCARSFGIGRTASLIGQGLIEILRRRAGRRAA